jgi:hypothetical protein
MSDGPTMDEAIKKINFKINGELYSTMLAVSYSPEGIYFISVEMKDGTSAETYQQLLGPGKMSTQMGDDDIPMIRTHLGDAFKLALNDAIDSIGSPNLDRRDRKTLEQLDLYKMPCSVALK